MNWIRDALKWVSNDVVSPMRTHALRSTGASVVLVQDHQSGFTQLGEVNVAASQQTREVSQQDVLLAR
jgi:hypothetical protein